MDCENCRHLTVVGLHDTVQAPDPPTVITQQYQQAGSEAVGTTGEVPVALATTTVVASAVEEEKWQQ